MSLNDAHAWPELYFEGVGWVRFEPTPAVRTGAAPSYSQPTLATHPGHRTERERDGADRTTRARTPA